MKDNSQQHNAYSRRSVLKGAIGGAAMTVFTPYAVLAKLPSLDDVAFLRVSSILTGIPLDKSYIKLGRQIWFALLKGADPKETRQWEKLVAVMAKLPMDASSSRIKRALVPLGPRAKKKAQQLARVWYTGRIWKRGCKPVDPKNTILRNLCYEVIDYDDALVWRACNFTKPPTTCGGVFGYWHRPFDGRTWDV